MKHFDIIILGAGASGCMTALTASKTGKSILLVDKLAKVGKKILATGNGRCNLTNINIFPSEKYYNKNIDNFLKRFNITNTLEEFNNLGLITYNDEEGRVYPISNSAKSVIDVINNEIYKNDNITLSLENEVKNVKKIGYKFEIKTIKGDFSCDKLVVATGGKSAEDIFEEFSIKARPFIPSLVALKTQNTRLLDGVKISNVKLNASCQNKTYIEYGEVLFKDSGISGIVTFNASTLFARANNFNGEINIDLTPNLSLDSLRKILLNRRKLNVKISKFFDGMFVSQIGYYILNIAKIQNEERNSDSLTDQEINLLANCIKGINLKVKGHYENNQVHSGGVLLSNLTDDLESKQIKNLYFCGEVCDVDGICGGYNLQWAWTSGFIVGKSI